MPEGSVQSSLTSSTTLNEALASTTEELFGIWQSTCLSLPSKKDSLRREAQSFFTSLTTGVAFVDVGVSLTTKPSHDRALAVLMQQLGPCFAVDSHKVRLCALSAMAGSLQGCAAVEISDSLLQLFGKFLLSHCSPLASDDEGNDADYQDYDEQVRDAALTAMGALLACGSDMFSVDAVRLRVELAKTAVENRCAINDDAMQVDHGYAPPSAPAQSGLSRLARSRRSLCFDVLKAGIDAVAKVCKGEDATVLKACGEVLDVELVQFATFTANCLIGESDPRCLLQLLKLFYTLLSIFQPLIFSSFPLTEIFDAISPYYPIQFTPPPGDPYGITKEGLQRALLKVLCYTGYDSADRESMLRFSLGLILERLVPMEEDEPTTMTEKREALKDLLALLADVHCDFLSVAAVRQLSDSLLMVHEEASLAVVKGGAEGKVAREAADLCRSNVAHVAFTCEHAVNKLLWTTFVDEPLQSLSSRLASSPSQGRVAIAYVACLASCGGPRTLRRSLEAGLKPLLDVLSSAMQDEEDVATAIYGIGAFCSACRESLAKAERDGVHVYPHPLKSFSTPVVNNLCALVSDEDDACTSLTLRVAAVRALESVLTSSPASVFDDEDVNTLARVIEIISAPLLSQPTGTESSESVEWIRACTQTMGRFLGYALSKKEPWNVFESHKLRDLMSDTIFPGLLASSEKEVCSDSIPRYDRKALVLACSANDDAASLVIGALSKGLHKSLLDHHLQLAEQYGRTLCAAFRQSTDKASIAYLSLEPPSITSTEIIKTLALLDQRSRSVHGVELGVGTSMLELPPSEEDRRKEDTSLDNSQPIVALLRPAYERPLSAHHLETLVVFVANALPALNEVDRGRLAVSLPFLSAALVNSKDARGSMTSETIEKMSSMANDLADFALGPDNFGPSRWHASLALQPLLAFYVPRADDICPSRKILAELVVPAVKKAIERAEARKLRAGSKAERGATLEECLGLVATLGSAAACRGGSSSRTADAVATFFVDIACQHKGSLHFAGECDVYLDITAFGDSANVTALALVAASLLGTVLSTKSPPLAKQRLTHISAKKLEADVKDLSPQAGPSSGVVAAAAHLICACKPQTMNANLLKSIARIAMSGLTPEALPLDGGGLHAVKKLVLAAVLKLLAVAPTTIADISSAVASGIMRAYATGKGDDSSDVAVKLLALQALESLAKVNNGRNSLETVKSAVVSILAAAMNHPSGLLRHAAVEVRNAWYVVGDT